MVDYYKVLGVKPTAAAAEIKSAYRRLARQRHPDVNRGSDSAAKDFALISLAWLANKLLEHGKHLKAGDVILTGSVHPPVFLPGPGTARWWRRPSRARRSETPIRRIGPLQQAGPTADNFATGPVSPN